jgi:thiol-disulfide isomerase/thioredoxin
MRLLAPLLVFLLLVPLGCKSGLKDGPEKTASRTREKDPSGGNIDDAWWRKNEPGEKREPFGPMGTDSGTDQPTSRTQLDSLLAGRVVDDAERPVADAFIQVTLVGEEGKKPIGVNTDRQGLFVIEGLRPGRTYELSARYEEGKRVLGQTVQVRAPNARVLMRVSESGVSSLTPAAQPSIGETGPFAAPKPKEKSKPETPPSSLPTPDPIGGDPLAPGKSEDYSPSGNVNRGSGNPPPPPAKKSNNSNVDPSLVGEANDPKRPMPATIPAPNPIPSRYEAPRPNPPPPRPAPPKPVTSSDTSLGSDPVPPKFDFTVRGLEKDSEWKFSTASGRLVLLDFWSTTCTPCLKALPETNQLASLYAASGLEVVGIACEAPDSFEVQAKSVSSIGQRNRLKYGLYLDGEKNPAQRLFQVKAVPTMVLLDRKGNVLWRGSGASRENFEQLEEAIKRGLKRQ